MWVFPPWNINFTAICSLLSFIPQRDPGEVTSFFEQRMDRVHRQDDLLQLSLRLPEK